jgi:CPA2 family monovalent cation:H+ antiporter-2
MIWLGYLVGHAFGWTRYESFFTGALIAISSTTIIVKAFAEQNIKGRVTEVVFGVLIVEDLIAILLLAILTGVATGAGLSAGSLAHIAGRLGGLLAVMLIAGLFIVPRLMRMVVKLGRPETIVVANIGVCFAFALLAEKLGYSVALGAFLGGALVAESGESHAIEPLIAPVRDVFAAVFFVAVGMQIDPKLVAENIMPVIVLTVVVVLGKLVGVTVGAFLAGTGVRTAVQSGMSLAQIGEFSFIIAGVGAALGATRSFLYPVAVAVSAITTLITPWLIRAGGPVASFVGDRMPPALQTYTSLYGSWVERLRQPRERAAISRARRTAGLLVIDVAVLAGIVIAAASALPTLQGNISARLHLPHGLARAIAIAAVTAVALPFVGGAMRMARALGAALAIEVLPTGNGVDLADAPRRGFVVGLQLTILALLGIPLAAAVTPFVPLGFTLAVLVLVLVLLGIRLWRTATNLQAHARAGAQMIRELLAAEARSGDHGAEALNAVRHMIPGLGEPEIVKLSTTAPALGRTLKQLNLRGLTGATVVALQQETGPAAVPSGDEVLAAGDVIVLAGSTEALHAARALLEQAPPSVTAPTIAAPGL